jgi:hypothetical protein
MEAEWKLESSEFERHYPMDTPRIAGVVDKFQQ